MCKSAITHSLSAHALHKLVAQQGPTDNELRSTSDKCTLPTPSDAQQSRHNSKQQHAVPWQHHGRAITGAHRPASHTVPTTAQQATKMWTPSLHQLHTAQALHQCRTLIGATPATTVHSNSNRPGLLKQLTGTNSSRQLQPHEQMPPKQATVTSKPNKAAQHCSPQATPRTIILLPTQPTTT